MSNQKNKCKFYSYHTSLIFIFLIINICLLSNSIKIGNTMNLSSNHDDKFFKKFTFDSWKKIKQNIDRERIRVEIEKNDIEMNGSDYVKSKNRPEKPCFDKELQVGKKLPKKYRFLFPKNNFGQPLEDLDEYYKYEYVIKLI